MTRETQLTIGRLAERTGCKVPTIRYYEQVGLMPAPARTTGNQRRYSEDHARRLGFIRHARDLGFTIETVTTLLELASQPERPCKEVKSLASENLTAVRSRISRLRALESELKRVIALCRGSPYERVPHCGSVERSSPMKASFRSSGNRL